MKRLRLESGDTVVLTLPDDLTVSQAELDLLHQQLGTAFPNNLHLILYEGTSIEVIGADTADLKGKR